MCFSSDVLSSDTRLTICDFPSTASSRIQRHPPWFYHSGATHGVHAINEVPHDLPSQLSTHHAKPTPPANPDSLLRFNQRSFHRTDRHPRKRDPHSVLHVTLVFHPLQLDCVPYRSRPQCKHSRSPLNSMSALPDILEITPSSPPSLNKPLERILYEYIRRTQISLPRFVELI
ncbi:hypothetical protein PC123_g25114 [Phytophthora cactorum]|nr:hypothetical protein PC123_g25114 [Phytophthora cactorum]